MKVMRNQKLCQHLGNQHNNINKGKVPEVIAT